MDWLVSLLTNPGSFSHNFLVFALVISLGLYIGKIRFFGISIGVTCVLFLGLIVSYAGVKIDPATIEFFRNFGLVIFVFFIGLQVGPSFFATFKNGGYGLNALMIGSVALSLLVTIVLFFIFRDTISLPQMLGVHYGAVTSTPGLGATQGALAAMHYEGEDIAVAYACAYPLAIMMTIALIAIMKKAFRINIEEEDQHWEEEQKSKSAAPIFYHVTVTNKALDNLKIGGIREIIGRPFICSRLMDNGVITSPTAETVVHVGDKMRIVSEAEHKVAVVAFCGQEDKEIDLASEHSPVTSRRLRVTREQMNGVSIKDLHLSRFDGVNITRVTRAGMTFFPYNSLCLQLGDTLNCVGPKNSIARLENIVGNRDKQLERPNVAAIFIGIALALILANMPIAIPGMPTTIKLGMAGGALIVAILFGYFGPRFHLVTYTTNSANLMLREWGISFFLASVGLAAGDKFFNAIINGNGLLYMGLGLIITALPTIIIGIIGRRFMKLNFHTLAGLIAGITTNTPTLVYAGSFSEKSTAVVAYSTVYPLAMFLRIISGQIVLVMMWPFVMG